MKRLVQKEGGDRSTEEETEGVSEGEDAEEVARTLEDIIDEYAGS